MRVIMKAVGNTSAAPLRLIKIISLKMIFRIPPFCGSRHYVVDFESRTSLRSNRRKTIK